MQIKVKLNYLRIAPRKVRQVVDLIRGKKAEEALNLLEFVVRKPADPVLKLLKSAIATAKHEFQIEAANLYVSGITVDEGPKLKRFRPVSRGSAHLLWKRTSHIILVLDEIKPTKNKNNPPIGGKNKEQEISAQGGPASSRKEEIVEPIKTEVVQEATEETDFPKKKERPAFKRQDFNKQKDQNFFNRIFRRKSI